MRKKRFNTIGEFIDSVAVFDSKKYTLCDGGESIPYVDVKQKINLCCKKHGIILVRLDNLKNNKIPCKYCSRELMGIRHRKAKDKFVHEIESRFPNRFDLSKVEYVTSTDPVKVRCIKHNHIFYVIPKSLLMGYGCSKCRYEKVAESLRLSKESFINISNRIFNNKYDYSKSIYVDRKTKVEIICPIHGSFYQAPYFHLRGSGCPKCGIIKRGKSRRSTQSSFIKRAKEKHNGRYDYSLVEYKTNTVKVKIICPVHGVFFQSPANHLLGQGCPKCNKSKSFGEQHIRTYLDDNNIKYIEQYKMVDCVYKKALPFDFAILNSDGSINFLIEYQGEQHFEPFRFKGGDKKFVQRLIRDRVKYNYCKKNNIPLYYITYKDKIEARLKELPF